MNSTSILNKDCYIYRVYDKLNDRSYIGLTTKTIPKRWIAHCNKAACGSKTLLHSAIRRYGKDNFSIECIETCKGISFSELCEKEIHYIKEYDTFYINENGYNMTIGGDGTYGVKLSQEVRNRMSESRRGKKRKPFTEEHRRNIGIASTKKIYTEDYRRKISEATKGKNNPMYGKIQTNDAREKMSSTKDRNSIPFMVKSPSGDTHEVRNVAKFSREHNLTHSLLVRLKNRKIKSHKDWTLL